MLWFAVLETASLLWWRGEELTAHLRPLFLEHPLTWFVALGLWLWLGAHFLFPSLEVWIGDVVSR